ncbi:MAG: hypothetical protein K2J72_11075, partial [Oscillospiraceae bacterium]|nr:hypothetical protein [Oscillospiraceae bacterium]
FFSCRRRLPTWALVSWARRFVYETAVGGVCPFAVNDGVKIYLDKSLKRFETVFPACGSSNSAAEFTCAELEQYAKPAGWADVCKGWRDEEKE